MKQRLKLASAIVHDPKLLILDEPTNGMDPAGREDILQLAHDLAHNKNMSLLFSSHLLPDVEAVCDHIVVLGGGKLLTQGDIKELKQAHDRRFEVRVKTDNAAFGRHLSELGCLTAPHDDLLLVELPQGQSSRMLWQAAIDQKQQIRHLRPQRSTLEEVFLKALEQN
jgi:ABC-2 type transport system ATP-binding protein